MIFSKTSGLRIVKSYAGSGTVQTIHEDENGGVWLQDPLNPPRGDGGTVSARVGRIVGDRIYEGR